MDLKGYMSTCMMQRIIGVIIKQKKGGEESVPICNGISQITTSSTKIMFVFSLSFVKFHDCTSINLMKRASSDCNTTLEMNE